jgi:hypothetical protein
LVVAAIVAAFSFTLSTPTSLLADDNSNAFDKGPKTMASKERVSVLIDRELRDGKSFIVLKISVPTDSTINAFPLEDPARLVVDFEGASIKKSENFTAPDNRVVKQVRLGAHTGKLRVVIDLLGSKVAEYDWKAGKRQAIITFVEGTAPAVTPVTLPTPPAAQPTLTPTLPSSTAVSPSNTPEPRKSPLPDPTPTQEQQPTLADVAHKEPTTAPVQPSLPAAATAALPAAEEEALAKDAVAAVSTDLGDLEDAPSGPPPTRVPTTFLIKGYKFEYLPNKDPVLKILLNKPNAQAQISKVDSETYKIELKDCGVENDDLELPQFPPHDFVGFVMVVAEAVGKNVEVSVSVEEDVTLTTSVRGGEVWVTKP